MAGGGEGVHELAADLVAAGADARTDGHNQIVRPRAELSRQHVHGRSCHSRSRAPPSGMNGGNGAALGVGKEQRNAVGGTNSDADARIIGDEGIARTRSDGYVANRV